jgi:tetratricopeptide (TPR) repeat protein
MKIMLVFLLLNFSFLHAEKMFPEYFETVNKCYEYISADKPQEIVEKEISILKNIFPNEYETLFLYGWYNIKYNINKEKGLNYLYRYIYSYQEGLKYLPKATDVYLKTKYNPELVRLYYQAIELESFLNQNYREASEIYKYIIEQDPSFEEARWRKAYLMYIFQYYNQAEKLLINSDFINSKLLLFDLYFINFTHNISKLKSLVHDFNKILSDNIIAEAEILIRKARYYNITKEKIELKIVCKRLEKLNRYLDEIVFYDDDVADNYFIRFSDILDVKEEPMTRSKPAEQNIKELKKIFDDVLASVNIFYDFNQNINLDYDENELKPIINVHQGNDIYFSKGLVDYIQKNFPNSQNDVWAVMFGHELAHIVLGDYKIKKFINKNIKDNLSRIKALQEIENNADKNGILFTVAAGYNPKYLNQLLRKFYEDFGNSPEHNYIARIENANNIYAEIYLYYSIFQDGIHFFNNRDYDRALSRFILFRTFFPNHKAVNNNIAMIYYYESIKKFIRNFELITSIDLQTGLESSGLISRSTRLDLDIRKIDFEVLNHGIRILENVVKRYPDYHNGINNLACMYIDYGAGETAEKYLNRLPDNSVNKYNNIGVLGALNGNSEKAIKFFNKALNVKEISEQEKNIVLRNQNLVNE